MKDKFIKTGLITERGNKATPYLPHPKNNRSLNHLKPNAQFLQCTKCGRKSWSARINENCLMTQPNGDKCTGVFNIPKE